MSTPIRKRVPPIKPSILEASPEDQEAWAAQFRAAFEAFGDGITEEEMSDEELDAFIRTEIDAQRAEDREQDAPRELETERTRIAA